MPQDPGPTRFFAFGLPKSGTTWLQMLLNAHPDVYCPAEDQLLSLHNVLKQVVAEYSDVLKQVDERTARQGHRPLTEEDALGWLRAITFQLWGQGVAATGINENSVGFNFTLFTELFPEAKFIQIIRDPRDIVVSSWDHNLRVEGSSFISRAHSLDEWCIESAQWWVDAVQEGGGRMFSIRYEDLLRDTVAEAREIFSFLGVDAGKADNCAKATDFGSLRATGNDFYARGKAGTWADRLDKEQAQSIVDIAGEKMERLGYNTAGLRPMGEVD